MMGSPAAGLSTIDRKLFVEASSVPARCTQVHCTATSPAAAHPPGTQRFDRHRASKASPVIRARARRNSIRSPNYFVPSNSKSTATVWWQARCHSENFDEVRENSSVGNLLPIGFLGGVAPSDCQQSLG